MKKLAYLTLPLLMFSCGTAEEAEQEVEEITEEIEIVEEVEKERKSPRVTVEAEMNDLTLSIDYGSPRVKEREIWGSLVPYDKIWRVGADEATAITFGTDVVFGGSEVASGTYALFVVPHAEGNWEVILNEEWSKEEHDVWGAYDHKAEKDVLTIGVTPQWNQETVEEMSFKIMNSQLVFEWELASFTIDIEKA
jgi:hypothetical protein